MYDYLYIFYLWQFTLNLGPECVHIWTQGVAIWPNWSYKILGYEESWRLYPCMRMPLDLQTYWNLKNIVSSIKIVMS